MLTEEQLEIISEAIQPLFQYLESEVIADIARRVAKTLSYSRTAELQALSMQKLGYSPARIRKEVMKFLNADAGYRKEVAKNTMEYKRAVRDIINNITKEACKANNDIVAHAGSMSWINDLAVWKQAGKELKDNSFLSQLVKSFAAQTAGELRNMTQSTGFRVMSGYEPVENAYKSELDKAVIKICSGTFSQDKVLRDVVHDLAQSGLRSIDYASGYSMQLDTASRLALRTGCHQLAGKVLDKNIEQTGENLVYVSKHWGARNTGTGHANHEQWQGKIYYVKPGKDYTGERGRTGQAYIMDLWYSTGYSADGTHENDPLGLYGYNCRHNHHPWFEGVSTFPKEQPEPEPVTINGKTYDYYAMTQKMRAMERAVRALKREKEALKALGMDSTETDAKIKRRTAEYREFCRACSVPEKTTKLRYECGTSDVKKTKAWKTYNKTVRDSSVKEYRVVDSRGAVKRMGDRIELEKHLSDLPQKARESLKDVTFEFGSNKGSGYSYSSKTIYLSENAQKREVIHEIGHHLEFALFDEKKVAKLKESLVQGLTKDDIIIKKASNSLGQSQDIYLLKSDRFIKDYQSRLYVDGREEALNKDGTINTGILGEVISVAVEYYYSYPNVMKKRFKDMYDFMEESLNGR